MKFTAPAAELAEAVAWVARATKAGTQNPSLAGVLMTASGRSMELQATDFHRFHRTALVLADTCEPGEVMISATTARDLLGAIDGHRKVTLSIADGRVLLSTGKLVYRLPIIETEHMPSWPQVGDMTGGGTVVAEELSVALRGTAHAIGEDKTPGVYLHQQAGQLHVLTMNVTSLAEIAIPFTGLYESDFTACVEHGALREAVGGYGGQITLSGNGSLLSIETDEREVVLRQFADTDAERRWKALLAASLPTHSEDSMVTLDTDDMVSALRRMVVSLPPVERRGPQQVQISRGDDDRQLHLAIHQSDGSVAGEEVVTAVVRREQFEVSVGLDLLLPLMRSLSGWAELSVVRGGLRVSDAEGAQHFLAGRRFLSK